MSVDTQVSQVKDFVLDQHKLVTYKWLSYQLGISAVVAKQVLFAFSEAYAAQVNSLFVLSGNVKVNDGSVQHAVRLVSADKLDSSKAEFENLGSVHVYSVQEKAQKSSEGNLWANTYGLASDLLSKKDQPVATKALCGQEYSSVVPEHPAERKGRSKPGEKSGPVRSQSLSSAASAFGRVKSSGDKKPELTKSASVPSSASVSSMSTSKAVGAKKGKQGGLSAFLSGGAKSKKKSPSSKPKKGTEKAKEDNADASDSSDSDGVVSKVDRKRKKQMIDSDSEDEEDEPEEPVKKSFFSAFTKKKSKTEKSTATPAEKPVEKAAEKTAEKPVEKAVEKAAVTEADKMDVDETDSGVASTDKKDGQVGEEVSEDPSPSRKRKRKIEKEIDPEDEEWAEPEPEVPAVNPETAHVPTLEKEAEDKKKEEGDGYKAMFAGSDSALSAKLVKPKKKITRKYRNEQGYRVTEEVWVTDDEAEPMEVAPEPQPTKMMDLKRTKAAKPRKPRAKKPKQDAGGDGDTTASGATESKGSGSSKKKVSQASQKMFSSFFSKK